MILSVKLVYNDFMKILLGEILNNKNLTVRQAVRLTGVPRSTLEDIINGRSSPRLSTLEQIAKGLKIHITDLYESPYK